MGERPRILFLVHSYHNHAGVEEHIKVLVRVLRQHFECFVSFPEQQKVWLLSEDGKLLSFPGRQLSIIAPHRAPEIEQSLAEILDRVKPQLIHIVHFVNWPLCVLELLLQLKTPLVISFHDYYAITPHYTMQGWDDPVDTVSAAYSQRFFGADLSGYLSSRRALLQSVLGRFQHLVVPSLFLKRRLQTIFDCEFSVIPYGIFPFSPEPPPEPWTGLRFGYLGSLLPQKGWKALLDGFLKVRERSALCSILFYGGELPFSTPLPGVDFCGTFEQAQIPGCLSEFDIGVIPSEFPETFSLVLSEMWQGEKPVAASDIGALGDRIIDGVNGRKFLPGNPQSIADCLWSFVEDQSWRSWIPPQPPLADQMGEEYRRLYDMALSS